MTSRDDWFSTYTPDSGEGSLNKHVGPRRLVGGFRVDQEQAPAIRTAFEEAVGEMHEARKAMINMQFMHGDNGNPVMDKYLAAMAEVGYGDAGSVTMAADSAVAEYQRVIEQLNRVLGGYKEDQASTENRFNRLRS